jgi:hypothetical protein
MDPMKPSEMLLTKLGSALVHAEEALGPDGRALDRQTFERLMEDPDVEAWKGEMELRGLLPVKRG